MGTTSYAPSVATVVGRDSELAAAEAFLAADAGFAALAIVGEPGIGKTTLWEEVMRRALATGALGLVARPNEAEAKLSFAALSDLVSGIDADAFDALPEPQRQALDVALLRARAAERPPERRTVGTALLTLLRHVAARTGVVIGIDDMQWLDPASRTAVEFAIRRLTDEPVKLIASVRAGADALSAFREHVERIELGPVSVASLHRILGDRLGRSFPRPTLVRIAEASAGNPLYALEIARLANANEIGASLPVPDDVRALVARRVAALPEETRHALLRTASLARPDLSLVDERALAPAEEADLVRVGAQGRINFVHPLFSSAVYAAASQARRRDVHRVLAVEVADPEERARHLALSCDGPDAEAAGAVARAARGARLRGASDAAAELQELALQLTPPEDARLDERRFDLGEQLLLAGDFHRSNEVLEALAKTADGDLRARALLLRADIVYWRIGEAAALVLAEEALDSTTDPLLRARAYAQIAAHEGTHDVRRAAATAGQALELLERVGGTPELVSVALSARVRADLFLGNGLDLDAAERARELEADAPPAAVDTRVGFKLGQWLRYTDDFAGARTRLEETEQLAHDEGDESSFPNLFLNLALLECWSGNWDLAAEFADRSHEGFKQVGAVGVVPSVWGAYVAAHFGRLDDVRAAAPDPDGLDEPIHRMLWHRTVGLAALAVGHAAEADEQLSRALDDLDVMDFGEPAVWRVHGDAIEAALAVGDTERAATRIEQFEQQAARSRIPWSLAVSARCRALLDAANGDLESAEAALERALDHHERCPMPFERARTLLALGQVLRRSKQRRRAREALEEAIAVFEQLGGEPWVERAREELERVRGRTAPDDLSPTELRIAELAATGLTNIAIAAEVFVTQKTVEANLARVYRKLGIRSRAQLAHALDARASELIP
jgi:DNA-binding CsgD family transcriptional regulator